MGQKRNNPVCQNAGARRPWYSHLIFLLFDKYISIDENLIPVEKIQLNVFPDIHYVQAAAASQSMLCDVFLQENFTQDMQPHYIYSPREMTRWVRGIHEALKPLESLSVEGLVRIWAHEALRLFQDR